MKWFSRLICVFVACIAVSSVVPTAEAHLLLPKPVDEYLHANPDATEREVNKWFKKNSEYDTKIVHEYTILIVRARQEEKESREGKERAHQEALERSAIDKERPAIRQFIWMGIIHILDGIDHVLFIVSLLLVPLAWKKVLEIITTFTVAHSLTLLLAGTDTLTVSPRIVEPIIAFSIAYVALTTVFLKHIAFFAGIKNRLAVIFLFGIFHGLGFAGVFVDFGIPGGQFVSSLLSFNIGVEIGQIIIVSIAFPLLIFLRKWRHKEIATKFFAASISIVALMWFVDRVV